MSSRWFLSFRQLSMDRRGTIDDINGADATFQAFISSTKVCFLSFIFFIRIFPCLYEFCRMTPRNTGYISTLLCLIYDGGWRRNPHIFLPFLSLCFFSLSVKSSECLSISACLPDNILYFSVCLLFFSLSSHFLTSADFLTRRRTSWWSSERWSSWWCLGRRTSWWCSGRRISWWSSERHS